MFYNTFYEVSLFLKDNLTVSHQEVYFNQNIDFHNWTLCEKA